MVPHKFTHIHVQINKTNKKIKYNVRNIIKYIKFNQNYIWRRIKDE